MRIIQPTFKGQNIEFWKFSAIYCKSNLQHLQHYFKSDDDLANRISIVIHTWILIEGFTKQVVWAHLLDKSLIEKSRFDELQELAERVKATDWKGTKEAGKNNGLDISNLLDVDLWRTINKINDFRNAVMHSNDLKIMFAYKTGYTRPETIEHFQDALDHFKNPRIGVMDKDILRGNDFDEMISEIFNSTFLNYILNKLKNIALQ